MTSSLGIHFGNSFRSRMGVSMPSMFPNMEDRPRLKSMTKNSTAQTWEPGISITASVKTMNARPVPDALWERRMESTCLYSIAEHYYQNHLPIDRSVSVPGQGTFEVRRTSVPHLQPQWAAWCSDIQASVRSCPGSCSGLRSPSGWSELRCCCRWNANVYYIYTTGNKMKI